MPSSSQPFTYALYGTVHTIIFKLWNPDSHNKELFIQETRTDGNTHNYDPEHFFYKLVENQDQANRLSEYWRIVIMELHFVTHLQMLLPPCKLRRQLRQRISLF